MEAVALEEGGVNLPAGPGDIRVDAQHGSRPSWRRRNPRRAAHRLCPVLVAVTLICSGPPQSNVLALPAAMLTGVLRDALHAGDHYLVARRAFAHQAASV